MRAQLLDEADPGPLLLDQAAGQLQLGVPHVLGTMLLVAGAVLVSWP